MTLIKKLGAIEKECCIKGCGEPGVYQPLFVVKDPRTSELDPRPPMRAYMQHFVCELHRRQLSIGAIMTDRIWSYIRNAYRTATNTDPRHNDVSLEFQKQDSVITIFGKQFGGSNRGKVGAS